MTLTLEVFGRPAPQGSKHAFVNKRTGRAHVVENSAAVRPWREAVKHAALARLFNTTKSFGRAPVEVNLTFYLPRPKGHFRTGKNANLLCDGAPSYPATKPDLDKLVRSTLDALTDAGVYADDSCVVILTAEKWFADDSFRPPGARIEVKATP